MFVIGATNRPNAIDPALLRPGRIDRLVYVNVPNEKERLQILKVHTKKIPLASNVDLEIISRNIPFFTGADINNLVREAVFSSLRENFSATEVTIQDFSNAMKVCNPSVSEAVIENYENLAKNIRKAKISDYVVKSFQEFM